MKEIQQHELITGQGICPICGSFNLNYGKEFLDDDYLNFPTTCEDCKASFEESYYLEYFQKQNIHTATQYFENDREDNING